jgi:hypothetical protein
VKKKEVKLKKARMKIIVLAAGVVALLIIDVFIFTAYFSYRKNMITIDGETFKNTCIPNIVDNFSSYNQESSLYLKFNNLRAYKESKEIACDFSSHNRTAFIFNSAWNRSGGPFSDGAFDFANSEMIILDSDELSPKKDGFSVSFWIKPSTFDFAGTKYELECECGVHPISKYSFSGGGQREWYFRIYNNSAKDGSIERKKRIAFYIFNLTDPIGVGSHFQDDLNENEWIHVVGTYNGTHTLIYKNGVLRDFDPISNYGIHVQNGNASMRIGKTEKGGNFQGSIDELRIFNRALSAIEVLELYQLNVSIAAKV